jgi:hypothetical protein
MTPQPRHLGRRADPFEAPVIMGLTGELEVHGAVS